MKDKQKIIIAHKVMTRKGLFEEKEKFRKVQAGMSFAAKIKALIELQKIAYYWGMKKDVIIWMR